MSVTVRRYKRGGWEVDVIAHLADGTRRRERKKFALTSRTAAQRWGEDRERHLLRFGVPLPKKEVPTIAEFAPRFQEDAVANRQKPSGVAAKETIIRVHLVPLVGTLKLDAITNERVQWLKGQLSQRAPKTVNNVLTVLNTLLKRAVEWGLIDRMPAVIRLLKVPKPTPKFHDFDEFERLVVAAESEADAYLLVLLGGEAGLRCGEMLALAWSDVDLAKRQLTVQQSSWKGHVTVPKGGRIRHVPLTQRLTAALRAHRHLRGPLVLSLMDGAPLTQRLVQGLVGRAARRATVRYGGVHVLRHTFCSHLAMRGAPARAIQELAGHRDLSTTLRYMHLSPAAVEGAIWLLDRHSRGDGVETAHAARGID